MTAETTPYDGRTRQHFADMVGLGQSTLRGTTAACVLLAIGMLGTSGWALVATRAAEDSVRRHIVYVDSNTNVVGVSEVGVSQGMPDGAFVDFARNWIRNLRARPGHVPTLAHQRKQVILTTDRRLWGSLQASMQAADEALRKAEVDVQEISANLVKREGETAILFVRWSELIQSGANKPQTYTATLNAVHQPPRRSKELEMNPLGIWASEFQITEVKP